MGYTQHMPGLWVKRCTSVYAKRKPELMGKMRRVCEISIIHTSHMAKYTTPLFLLVFTWLLSVEVLQAQNAATLAGYVTDIDEGIPLFGASVLLVSNDDVVLQGVLSDAEGRFQFARISPGEYTVEVDYVGYASFEIWTSLSEGETQTINAALIPENVDQNAREASGVVTTSWRAGRVLESPAPLSIIEASRFETEVTLSTVSALRHTVGVDLAQTSLDRSQIALRGFNNSDFGHVAVLHDDRQPNAPSGLLLYSALPGISVDIDHIEVVRGSVAGVRGIAGNEGVIHFITKDPFEHPGTSFAISGGERSTFSGQYRHAGVIGDQVGYKITAMYTQADEWQLDPENPIDRVELERDVVSRSYDYSKIGVNGMLQFRLGNASMLTANAGYAESSSPILTSLVTLQGKDIGDTYAQLRLQSGSFFAQAYGNWVNSRDTYAYTTGLPVTQDGARYAAETKFSVESPNQRQRFVVGADAHYAVLSSNSTVTGRFEADDNVALVGGYVHSTFSLSSRFDINLTLRADWNDVDNNAYLSPGASLVFKPSDRHMISGSFVRVVSSPDPLDYFLDMVVQEEVLGASHRRLLLARGAEAFSFEQFRQTNAARLLLPDDEYFGQDVDVHAVPLAALYDAAAADQLILALRNGAPIPGPVLTGTQRRLLADLLEYTALNNSLSGSGSTGASVLGIPNAGGSGFQAVDTPMDRARLELPITHTAEVGYRGLIGVRSLFTMDVYYTRKENAIGPVSVITPYVYMQGNELSSDVESALDVLFASNSDDRIQSLLLSLNAYDIPTDQVAEILGMLVGETYAGEPVAIVQTDQDVLLPWVHDAVGGISSVQNYGPLEYWGFDASFEYLPSNNLSLFANVSYVSNNLFDNTELGEEDPTVELALNASALKLKGGIDYLFDWGLSLNLSGRYNQGFPVRSGFLVGEVDDYWTLDAGVGYNFNAVAPGLRLDVFVQNVTDRRDRSFVGTPAVGRLALARLTYMFE